MIFSFVYTQLESTFNSHSQSYLSEQQSFESSLPLTSMNQNMIFRRKKSFFRYSILEEPRSYANRYGKFDEFECH